jgi:hypothetical protein
MGLRIEAMIAVHAVTSGAPHNYAASIENP